MTDTPKLKIMVDANVLFAGYGWPRFPQEVLRHAVKGDYQLILSARIIEEARKAIERHFGAEYAEDFDTWLTKTDYQEVATPSKEEEEANITLVRDAKDVHVALAAINAQADYLVTSDKDFTDPDEPIHQHIKILLPGTFLREHMNWTSEELETIRTRKRD